MANRKYISKRRRFAILKRDRFACQYCGRRAPDAVLEVDHIVPVARGGSNDDENLVAACTECNSGKHCLPVDDPSDVLLNRSRIHRAIELGLEALDREECEKAYASVDPWRWYEFWDDDSWTTIPEEIS